MKRILIIVTSILFGVVAVAQNYQTIYSGNVGNFEDPYHFVYCNKVDSIKVANGDSSFYFMKNLLQNTHGENFTLESSWLGTHLDIKSNGDNVFYNFDDEPIVIKTLANLGDSWYFFESNNLKIQGTVRSIDNESFLGLTDMVKTIRFSATDSLDNVISHSINNYEIKLSKSHGFVETMNFYFLGYDLRASSLFDVSVTAIEFTNLSLVGLESPEVGLQNLTTKDVYDFNVGDEYHFVTSSSVIIGINYAGDFVTNEIMKILERNETDTGTTYLAHFEIETIDPGGYSSYSNDTSYVNYGLRPELELYPGEFSPFENNDLAFDYSFKNDSLPRKVNLNSYGLQQFSDGTWNNFLPIRTGVQLVSDGFVKGFGGEYYHKYFHIVGGEDIHQLVYYKKGEAVWGDKLIIVGVGDVSSESLNVFPNPTKNQLVIDGEWGEVKQASIYDTRGVLTKVLNFSNEVIDVSDLQNGVYLLQIETAEGVRQSRFVKE